MVDMSLQIPFEHKALRWRVHSTNVQIDLFKARFANQTAPPLSLNHFSPHCGWRQQFTRVRLQRRVAAPCVMLHPTALWTHQARLKLSGSPYVLSSRWGFRNGPKSKESRLSFVCTALDTSASLTDWLNLRVRTKTMSLIRVSGLLSNINFTTYLVSMPKNFQPFRLYSFCFSALRY